jgi:hypothetical protein
MVAYAVLAPKVPRIAMSIAKVLCSALIDDRGAFPSESSATGLMWEEGKSHGGLATKRTPQKATKLQSASFQVNGSRSQTKHTIAVMVGIRKVMTVASEISSQDRESVMVC